MNKNILVLMSTYNGEKYLPKLLDSVLSQNEVNVSILVRDDGSTDNTINILEEYKKFNNIRYYKGDNIGYAKSFWNLLTNCDDYDFYAFCDQDDIWLPNKLINAIYNIEKNIKNRNEPILYTSNVIPVNNNMDILNDKFFKCKNVLNPYESLQKSILPGCTFVFNYYAKEILKKYQGYMESHDWAAYTIITTLGKVIYDKNSYIYYRIHENNTIGTSNSKIADFNLKVKRFFKKSDNTRSRFAKDFYNCYKDLINYEYKKSIKNLGYYRDNILCKMRLLLDKNFKGIIFKIYIILNRV